MIICEGSFYLCVIYNSVWVGLEVKQYDFFQENEYVVACYYSENPNHYH